MTDKLIIEKLNDVYMRIQSDASVAMELSEHFTFSVPNARFSPQFRNKVWDGKIRLFALAGRTLYLGLIPYVEEFAKQRNYQIEYVNRNDFCSESFSIQEANDFASTLSLPLSPRDYQIAAFTHAVRNRRALLLSPTASGKSLIIYLLTRYYESKKKTLIIVPTTSLVHQMASDFESYGAAKDWSHKIFSGEEKITDRQVIITTWQSIYKLPKPWFAKFDTVIGDEAHLFKAKSLISIMSKLESCSNRFGFTGTLDGTHTNKLVLEGLFGAVKQVTTTAELIEQKHLSAFKIKAIILKHPDGICEQYKKSTYDEEINYLFTSQSRTNFIVNLIISLKGNTLLLFKTIDHGQRLYREIGDQIEDGRKIFYVDGGVDGVVREETRKAIEQEENSVIVASLGTFSTGINIRNLHNIVFASPSKSRVKTLQSIGRGLRKSDTKTLAVLYDIADDMSWKSRNNFTLLHFAERIKMYNEEMFDYKTYNVKLKE
jgi:superfamily II DNA or RNA helicase